LRKQGDTASSLLFLTPTRTALPKKMELRNHKTNLLEKQVLVLGKPDKRLKTLSNTKLLRLNGLSRMDNSERKSFALQPADG